MKGMNDMMYHEFMKLAGYEVTFEDYTNIIEPMYNATDLDKIDFIKCLDKKRFALPTKNELIKAMRKEAEHLADICGHHTDFESQQKLEKIATTYATRFFGFDFNDLSTWVYFESGYEYPELQRGCTYPKTLIIGKGNKTLARISLVK